MGYVSPYTSRWNIAHFGHIHDRVLVRHVHSMLFLLSFYSGWVANTNLVANDNAVSGGICA